jgi:hypothetical protein
LTPLALIPLALISPELLAQVRHRVDRIIDEQTGLMRELSDTVMLRNIWNSESLTEECLCYGQLGDCPRGEVM